MVPNEMFSSLCHRFQRPDSPTVEGVDEGGATDKSTSLHLISAAALIVFRPHLGLEYFPKWERMDVDALYRECRAGPCYVHKLSL